ncbi:DUF6516 family protein [uncultured Vibrio sp.]|uniref:toxin-antitoxin system TumE family protein n=1 Tax=uncultured Vibrio sp. TaxID=114054 RepID=UPI002620FEA8|nr:DUF6516 family protein [uncultured Vibrio sp.]
MEKSELVGLDVLIDLHGTECHFDEPEGYYWRIEAWKVEKTKDRPHGLSYRLTLHNNHNKRIMGYDNAHEVKATKRHKITGVKNHTIICIDTLQIKGFYMSLNLRRNW